MEWVWELYKKLVYRELLEAGRPDPADDEIQRTFLRILSECTVTVLVQEPWQNSVRFKTLAKFEGEDMTPLIRDPMGYLRERFGGGKFKLNFHRGWSFVATQNFKPEGEPKWREVPELES